MRGILVDENNELVVENGSLKIGDRKMQDAWTLLSLNQGELKSDPIAGANLLRMIRGGVDRERIRKMITVSLERVGIQFDDIKSEIGIIINKKNI